MGAFNGHGALPSHGLDSTTPIADVSGRLAEQGRRNRVMDVLEVLAAGDRGVRQVGVKTFYASFFEWSGGIENWDWCAWQVFTAAEVRLLTDVQKVLMVPTLRPAGSHRTRRRDLRADCPGRWHAGRRCTRRTRALAGLPDGRSSRRSPHAHPGDDQ
ncbi:hypothetical protein HGK34_21025 [Myceligenerans sp. I2]|uniref:Uncharacterized protein n=1 Tax=Myceligenerans indicum TaxID=2593663 RepID=A0ABS1LRU2_9MICO|nr:hypothetical protein [Myceligenerans indicum]